MHNHLVTPYLPLGSVTKVILSGDSSEELRESFKMLGIDLILTDPLPSLPSHLSKHADLQLVNVCEGLFVYAPGVSSSTLAALKNNGFDLIEGSTALSAAYPYDIAYNCSIVGKHAFLNPRYTDKRLIELLKKCDISIEPVKQGYAKCSTCILSDEAIITADITIHQKAVEIGLDSLIIPPQKNITLTGYNYGFIGGSTGLISRYEMAFLGSLNSLNSGQIIIKFLKKHGLKPISMTKENLVDLGGLIPLSSV